MSFTNLDQVFHGNPPDSIPRHISKILRSEYGASGSALKRIGNKINVSQRTVKNWYEGQNTPNLVNFIKLASSSPDMLTLFLLLCGYDDMAKIFSLKNQQTTSSKNDFEVVCYSIIFDTNHSGVDINSLSKLHQRRLWFYSEVSMGNKPNAETLSKFWSVSLSTAKRDIAFLTNLKLIGFVGSRRSGFYVSRQPIIM